MSNITIQYSSRTSDHHWAADTVHAMDTDGKLTLCGRRPAHFTETADGVTCQKCLSEMLVQAPVVKAEKPVERVRKPHKPEVKHRNPQSVYTKENRPSPSKGEPEFARSRSWVLTPRGQALVDKWEQEERGTA